MNTGVALLLKRMETHPEEFIVRINHGTSQWGMLIQQFADHFDEEDHVALKAGIRKCHQEVFTGKVMQALAGEDVTSEDPKSLEDVIKQYRATGISSVGQTLTSAITDAQAYQSEMMRRHLDEHRKALKSESRENKSKLMEMLDSYVEYGKKKATQR